MARRRKKRQVALAFPLAVPHLALFMQGVARYARAHGGWTFIASPMAGRTFFPETLAMSVESLRGWPGDGAIVIITTRAQARAARELGIPAVNLAGALRQTGVPRVMVDHEAMGRLAAEHLITRGLRRFGYMGVEGVWYSQLRARGFAERIERAGGTCDVHEIPRRLDARQPWHLGLEDTERWLRGLTPPVGVLAVHDYRARMLIDVCDKLGLDVPHDVALMGIDNDETVCEFCDPPLTSVSRSGEQVGYEAAALLGRLMAGKPPPPGDVLIPPDGVIERRSTDTVAFEDAYVTACVRHIRDQICEAFGVERLIAVAAISRRLLERRFKRHTGMSPHQFLSQARVDRVKHLLAQPAKLPLHRVAALCGFTDTRRLRLTFTRLVGQSPAAYRHLRSAP